MYPLQGVSFLGTPLQGGILKPPALRVVDDCYERFLHPFYDAFCATDRPGDCTAGPTPPARGPLEPCRCVWGGSPLTRGAVATPSAPGLFFPNRILSCHRKKCANI